MNSKVLRLYIEIVTITVTAFALFGPECAHGYPDDQFNDRVIFDLSKLRAALARLKAEKNFLPLFPDGKKYDSKVVPSERIIPDFIQKRFYQLNNQVFGRGNVLSINACRGCDPFVEVGESMRVNIDPVWIDEILHNSSYKDPQVLIDFILAHEISHYVYEYEVLRSLKHESPHGQGSYFTVRLHNADFLRTLFSLSEEKMFNSRFREAVIEETSKHAEVDAFAFTVLADMNAPAPVDFLTWLRNWTIGPREPLAEVGGATYIRINSFKELLVQSLTRKN